MAYSSAIMPSQSRQSAVDSTALCRSLHLICREVPDNYRFWRVIGGPAVCLSIRKRKTYHTTAVILSLNTKVACDGGAVLVGSALSPRDFPTSAPARAPHHAARSCSCSFPSWIQPVDPASPAVHAARRLHSGTSRQSLAGALSAASVGTLPALESWRCAPEQPHLCITASEQHHSVTDVSDRVLHWQCGRLG
jgi:hypothetical protein